jgi:endonuclease/exonuclease/phosphatase family metal-dependent hydrolase
MDERLLEVVLLLLAIFCAVLGYGRIGVGNKHYEPAPHDRTGLRVVTWNVGGMHDGGRPMTDDRLSHVAQVLHALDADLILLQELASKVQVEQLRDYLGHDWSHAVGGSPDRYLGVLCQRGHLEVRITINSLIVCTYHDLHPEMIVAVANLHASPTSARLRNGAIGGAMLALRRERQAHAQILAGDLNLDVDLDKRRDLFTNDEYRDVESYNFIVRRLTDAAIDTGSTAEPDRRLDYIFVQRSKLEVENAGPWKDQRADDMDHDPVVADLRYRLDN